MKKIETKISRERGAKGKSLKRNVTQAFLGFFLLCLFGGEPVWGDDLAAPKLLRVKNIAGAIRLEWEEVPGATGYHVYRKSEDGFERWGTVQGGSVTTFKDKGVYADETYKYFVKAVKNTKPKMVSKLSPQGLTIVYCEKPALPSAKDTQDGIYLSWEPTDYCQGYLLYRKEEGGKYKKIAVLEDKANTWFLDTEAKPGISYYYALRSFRRWKGHLYYSARDAKGIKAIHEMVPSSKGEERVYRALLVGDWLYEDGFEDDLNLSGPPWDTAAMEVLLTQMGYRVVRRFGNLGRKSLLRAISSTFVGADENDVSLFFYSGHGTSAQDEEESGALMLSEDDVEFFTLKELAGALKKVPGKCIVILDSCGSGAGINAFGEDQVVAKGEMDSSLNRKVSLDMDPSLFNRQVIEAFLEADNPHVRKYGELAVENKFYVITATQAHQPSVEVWLRDGFYGGALTYGLVEGGGFAYFSTAWSGSLPADLNKDEVVSLEEAYRYARKKAKKLGTQKSGQVVQRYPQKSSFPLYGIPGAKGLQD